MYLVYSIVEQNISIAEKLDIFYNIIGTGLPPYEVVPAAFGLVLLAKGDPLKTAIYATNCSGDADTLGAIATSISGAMSGVSSISDEYIKNLQDANRDYNFEKIIDGLTEIVKRKRSVK